MPTNILMPALSPTMEKGNLARWLKKEGDKIKSGDIIAEIETDKATMEYEAVDEGTLAKIVVPEGTQDVAVNAVIAVMAGEGEDVKAAAASAKATPAKAPEKKTEPAPHPAASPPPSPKGGGISAPRGNLQSLPTPWGGWRGASRVGWGAADTRCRKPRFLFAARAPSGERCRRRSCPRQRFGPAWPRDCARY